MKIVDVYTTELFIQLATNSFVVKSSIPMEDDDSQEEDDVLDFCLNEIFEKKTIPTFTEPPKFLIRILVDLLYGCMRTFFWKVEYYFAEVKY
jgi:hypothetical protein